MKCIGAVLRAGLSSTVLLVLLASCSTLMTNQEQALRDGVLRNHGPEAARRVDRWLALRGRLQYHHSLSDSDKVQLVNDFFNALPWRSDWDNWQQEDYWATPLETLLSNGGDCEDLAIAKYFTLLASGIDTSRLRLTYAWQLAPRRAHMVLAYLPPDGGDELILDNLVAAAMPLSQRSDLEAVYSFNQDKLWLAASSLQPVGVASQDRLPRWRRVNERMEAEASQQSWLL